MLRCVVVNKKSSAQALCSIKLRGGNPTDALVIAPSGVRPAGAINISLARGEQRTHLRLAQRYR
jgi:hypothetical protein